MKINDVNWSKEETMMASAYINIANSLPYIQQMMEQHIKSVQNGGGVITNGDLEEVLNELANMINKNLYGITKSKVSINFTNK